MNALEAARSLSPEMRRDFAVVVPAYNEAPVIPELIRALKTAFQQFELDGEVILVDDGSDDGTADMAEREGEGWTNLRVLRHRSNLGKTEAMVTAAEATDRSYLVLFDADLQHLPEEIPRFLAKLQEGWDVVTGRKMGEYQKPVVSGIYNWLSRRIFDVPVSDLNSMKAFRREVVEELPMRHDWHRFFVVMAYCQGLFGVGDRYRPPSSAGGRLQVLGEASHLRRTHGPPLGLVPSPVLSKTHDPVRVLGLCPDPPGRGRGCRRFLPSVRGGDGVQASSLPGDPPGDRRLRSVGGWSFGRNGGPAPT